ncbi:cytochrome P450 [Nocardia sp. 004]|uniref:cytochrome P450 n=1 Tax=Nocardia sp. 004 TaxID=3385978 RepID=UPI0039A1763D
MGLERRVRCWLRWSALHGLTRTAITLEARRKQPLALLLAGADRASDHYDLIEQIRIADREAPTNVSGIVTADLVFAREILRDNRFVAMTPASIPYPAPLRWIIERTELGLPNPIEPPAMLAVDPPHHTRFRKLVSRAFTPKAVSRLEGTLHQVTTELLGTMERKQRVDLISDYASQVPVSIIAEMLDMPRSDTPMLLEWGDHVAALLDFGMPWQVYREANEALAHIDSYFDNHLARLRRQLRDNPDLDGIMANVIREGDLTDFELKATMALLLAAGFDTTTNLIGNGIVALLGNPDQLAYLQKNPDQWNNAVEEILRYDPPVQMVGRVATETVNINGRSLQRGEIAALLIGGANRDPEVFDQPAKFDVARDNARQHISFSGGVHSCLGANLARMEGVVALRALFENFPDLALADDPTPGKHINLRGYRHLPVDITGKVPTVLTTDVGNGVVS